MKYRFNTRLACFACIPDFGKMLANITWYRYEAQDRQAVCFTQDQMEQFRAFVQAHSLNFPGPHYVQPCDGEDFSIPLHSGAKAALPHYLILTKDAQGAVGPGQTFLCPAVLLDENSDDAVAYCLDFCVVGRLEVYRQLLSAGFCLNFFCMPGADWSRWARAAECK